ncbi:F0F1 ATP synthase subunit A [Endothiovibrio diazotrophicus]
MEFSSDHTILWQWGLVKLNATILYTWLVMALLAGGSWAVSRRLSSDTRISHWQNLLEVIVVTIRKQVHEISQSEESEHYLPFVGTLYLFIALSGLLGVIPGFHPPTGSLSTTAALAACVFVAVPLYGIRHEGLSNYLRHYFQPSPLMFPFHLIGELTRTLALAVRLFGNVLSGVTLGAIIIGIAPLFFPVLLQVLELLIGQVQAFIFAILATVYIASAAHGHHRGEEPPTKGEDHG